ncbi:protein kinase, putative [Theileria annulata]|uniref:Protein kinase, putative n=1 Tax=Theileria annulata TaxID=5874 RepID=Q4UB83_THEAN|nr:protein kinase, putative [Theileria annulata]CAI75918.1 protein kinase, putative [Theileria annulata]|eukprot:XP_955394.1 protein kinase, putative [Theileria annulata]
MSDLSSLLEKEEISWPNEFKPVELVPGSNQIGDCWKVACFTHKLVKSLEEELKKRRRQLDTFEYRYEELNQQLGPELTDDEAYESYDYDLEGEIGRIDMFITKLRDRIQEVFLIRYFIFQIESQLTKLRNKYDSGSDRDSDTTDASDDKGDNKDKQEFFNCYAKLILNPFVIRDNSCINEKHQSTTVEYQLNSILKEVEKIRDSLESFSHKTSNKGAVMKILSIEKVLRKREPFTDTWVVLYATKEMTNGSVGSYLKALPNRDNVYQLQDSLLYLNLKEQISLMKHMQKHGIAHNNIKPNNVLISKNGLNLLLTDFCPETLFIERCYKISQGKLTHSNFTSPELLLLLTNEVPYHNVNESNKLMEEINSRFGNYDFPEKIKPFMHRSDVFSLGLIYYHLLTLKIPSEQQLVYDDIISDLKEMLEKRNPGMIELYEIRNSDLINLVMRMLLFDPFRRGTWEELLVSSDKKKKSKSR